MQATVFSYSNLAYHILVSGSYQSLIVPILYDGHIEASVSKYGQVEGGSAYAALQFYTDTIIDAYEVRDCISGCIRTLSSALDVSDSILVKTGKVLNVFLFTNVNATYSASAFALADPYFRIDPLFLVQHPDYSLTFSQFVGNDPPAVSGIPEPATWATLIAGFALLGGALRRRRRSLPALA